VVRSGSRWCIAGLIASALWALSADAQVQLPLRDPTGRSGDQPEIRQEQLRPAPSPGPFVPTPLPALPRESESISAGRVLLREIRVVGSTVFTAEQVAQITRPYLNRMVSQEDLEALRLALTMRYVEAGYVNSGAILPQQKVADGAVTYRIVEGHVTHIDVQGNRWFRTDYLQRRLRLSTGPPLNVNALQERLQILLEDQRIQRMHAELQPGLRPGEARLAVQVEERSPLRVAVGFDNYQAPSIGAERGMLTVEHRNLTGNGDVLSLQFGRSRGLEPLLDFRYAVPVNAQDTTIGVQYRKNTQAVVEEPFRQLDIESKSDIYGVMLRHPVQRSRDSELALELSAERLSNTTSLLGERFTLSPGAHRGKSVVSAVRFAQEVVHRSQDQVIAARSRFSVGVNELGATLNPEPVASGRFFSWLGQFQWLRRTPILDSQLVLRADAQLTPDSLLALEQFAVGGRYTVRGYRENTFVSDNAVVLSLEARIPIVRDAHWAQYLELVPFFDHGTAWNTHPPGDRSRDIASAGIGLRWGATIPAKTPLRTQLEIYWGHPFRHIDMGNGNLQDKGLHLQLSVSTL
jgi:hemolysin activation/secretion protein